MNNFSQQLQEQIKQYGDDTAIIFQDKPITYNVVVNSITGAANFFKHQGVAPGNKVMLRADDSPNWLYALFGLIHIGAVPVILSTQFIPGRASEIAAESNCMLAVVNRNDAITGVKTVVLDDIDVSNTSAIAAYNYQENEVGFMIASSGTTGKNKLVVHGHRSWRASVDILLGFYTFPKDEVVFATSKMSFQYVWSKVFATLWTGEKLVIHHKLIIGTKLLDFINRYQVTRLITSPPILLTLVKLDPSTVHGAMESVRMIISGGEPIRDHVESDMLKMYGKLLHQCYGSSEVITIPTAQNYNNEKMGSIGRRVNGVELKVINENGHPAAIDEVGELYVKMPSIALEYLNNPTASAEVFKDGWYKTNDLVRVDQDGFYFFVGRKNDVQKINGIFVSPIEIELAMLGLSEIKDCMVGIEKRDNGKSIVIANIILEDSIEPITPEFIRKYLTSRLESYKIPRVIKFIDNIPRTVTGKKMRAFIQK